jgi:hypothetical protein
MIRPAIYGSILWFCGATFIKYADFLFQFDTPASTTVILYIATIPIAYTGIHAMPYLSVCKKNEIQRSTLIGSAVALMLDGLALVFFPSLYGRSVLHNIKAGAWLLWGAGWFFVSGL